MSNLDFTPKTVVSLLDDTEQLSLAVLMLISHSKSSEMKGAIVSLASLLNQDLQELRVLNLLQNQSEGGMGDAPMIDALELSPC